MAENEVNPTNREPTEKNEVGQSEAFQARVAELESLLAQKDEKIGLAESKIAELEKALADSEKKLNNTSNALSQAIANYKVMVIRSNPGIIEELIVGNSIEEINSSLEKAKTIIIKVRKDVEEEIASSRVPAGAPQRTSTDLSALSPREKIQYAIGGKK
ncbi:MAG: hypothetical protein FJ025_00060 [Chloroflexi bacterium]|nr:hypothetical protein [Chloroflexota bacterium]